MNKRTQTRLQALSVIQTSRLIRLAMAQMKMANGYLAQDILSTAIDTAPNEIDATIDSLIDEVSKEAEATKETKSGKVKLTGTE